MRDNNICIMGMGYVGLTLGAVMADRGFSISGIEINEKTLGCLQQGKAHFFEKNLDLIIQRNITDGRLRFAAEIPANEQFDVYIITVGTPIDETDTPQMHMVEQVARAIAANMQDGAMVLLRSTVRLGTTTGVVKPILDASGKKYDLAFCPERTMEGNALAEIPSLPQVVGGHTTEASERATNLFRRLTPTILTVSSLETAELIKLLDNSFRDVTFSFGNEVALMCEKLGLKAQEVIYAANTGYPRTSIAKPGFVGGPCLFKDPHILANSLQDVGFVPKLISTGREINRNLIDHVLETSLKRKQDALRISLMGMAFKGYPENDDLRNSPSVDLLYLLQERVPDAEISCQDYVVKNEALAALGVHVVDDQEAFRNADLVMVLNNHQKYSELDIEERSLSMNRKGLICDVWNVLPIRGKLPNDIDLYVLGAA